MDALAEQDPDPEAWVRALAVQAARPDPTAKQGVWEAAVDRHEVPLGSFAELSTAFWRPGQAELLGPYAERFRAAMPTMHEAGMMAAISVSGIMFPWFDGDERFADDLVASAAEPEVSPLVGGPWWSSRIYFVACSGPALVHDPPQWSPTDDRPVGARRRRRTVGR